MNPHPKTKETAILLVDDIPNHTHRVLREVLKQKRLPKVVVPTEKDASMDKRSLETHLSIGALTAHNGFLRYVPSTHIKARKIAQRAKKKRIRKLAKYHRSLNRNQRKSQC